MEFAIGGPETGSCDESGKVGGGRILDRARQSAPAKSGGEAESVLLKPIQILGRIFRGLPRIRKARCIMIADDRVFLSLRRRPSATPGCPVRKVPGQHKGVVGFIAR